MKKIFVLSLMLMLVYNIINAQITITGNDLPKSGRVNLLSHDTLSNPNVGVASSNAQTWDFTAVNSNYPQVTSYSSTSPFNQYASSFPTANIYAYGPSYLYGALAGAAPINYSNFGYMFLSSDVNGLSVIGYKSAYGLTHQVQKEVILQTPAHLNDTYNDTSYWEVFFNHNPADIDTIYKSSVQKTLTVDAFGSMTTAFGTFDVLRVWEHFVKIDSVFASLSGTVLYKTEMLRDTINNFHFWANGIGYPIAIVNTNAHFQVTATEILVDTLPNYQITGTVYNTDTSAVVTSGKAQLIPKNAVDNFFGVQEVVDIDNNGHFQFSNVLQFGNFLIIAIPDATLYPELIPTYYGDSIYWQDALTMQAHSDTGIFIYCRNNLQWQNYPGNGNNISGIVWQNLNDSKGPANSTPARGIRVTLEKNPGGQIIRHTETDNYGKYTFADLPSFSYITVVDVPGLGMDSTYYLDLTGSNDKNYPGYDFVYDSTKVYIYDATFVNPSVEKNKIELSIYPNPYASYATVGFYNPSYEMLNYNFQIFDVTGRSIKSYSGSSSDGFTINSENMENGIYFYQLYINNKLMKSGKIMVKN